MHGERAEEDATPLISYPVRGQLPDVVLTKLWVLLELISFDLVHGELFCLVWSN